MVGTLVVAWMGSGEERLRGVRARPYKPRGAGCVDLAILDTALIYDIL